MAQTISSRTPEGTPNWCPVCRSAIYVEPSPMGDAPCPSCGVLLWFYDTPNGLACRRFAEIAGLRDRLFAYFTAELGVNMDAILHSYATREPLGVDSLDLVELVMEVEEEFEIEIPDEHARYLTSLRALIDYLLRRGL